MRILVKHGSDQVGTYRPVQPGESARGALRRAARADYPERSAQVMIREHSAYAEWGDDWTNYSIES